MRLIDADALKLDIMCVYGCNPKYINWLNHAPTVDAVPVIRCKDCVWNREKEWVDCYMSGMHGRNINNFCSRGERKDE